MAKKLSLAAKKQQALRVIEALKLKYPEAICSLQYKKPYELLIAVRLSAQCTDARVNLVTPALFAAYPTLESLANAKVEDIEGYVRSCGFYHAKAQSIVALSKMLIEEFDGVVPDTIEQLVRLPGVGRKTANLMVGDVYGKPAIVADTHCIRIAGLLGLTDSKDPYIVEQQLRACVPAEEGNDLCHRFVLFGREICVARRPKCEICPLAAFCPGAGMPQPMKKQVASKKAGKAIAKKPAKHLLPQS